MIPSIKKGMDYLIHNKYLFCDSIVKNFLRFLPDKLYISLRYRCQMGYWVNWKHPKTFTEKLQWLKVYNHRQEYTMMVDKYAVKQYVADRIGWQHIIPTLGVWDKAEDINWDTLPKQFVLKTTHGGGSGGVVLCKDKMTFDKNVAIVKLNKSMSSDIYSALREWPYKNVKRQVIAEKFMIPNDKLNDPTYDLTDYKFFCFNGVPKFCQVIRDRHTCESIDFYDMAWNHLGFVGLNPVARNGLTPVARPEHFDEMKGICKTLSANVPFLRVDLYEINGDVYFGELTFYPASGFGHFTPPEWNKRLGELIQLG